ncbi:hypothetical protein PR048_005228, partial [Dryococelus australis]
MSRQKQEVLLFLDNCTAHKSISVLENFKVVFLPLNMTSIVQPIDQGVSRMCNHAWEIFKSETILYCFWKAGFTQRRNEIDLRDQNQEGNDEEIRPAVEGFGDLTSSSVSYEESVTMDDDVCVCGEQTDAEDVAEVGSSRVQISGSSDEGIEHSELPVQPLPTSVETIEYIPELR